MGFGIRLSLCEPPQTEHVPYIDGLSAKQPVGLLIKKNMKRTNNGCVE